LSWRKVQIQTGSLDTSNFRKRDGRKNRRSIFCFHLGLDPLLRRLDIGGSNKEEDLLDVRLNPQYLLHKHYEETRDGDDQPAMHCADTLKEYYLNEFIHSCMKKRGTVPFPRKPVEPVIRMLLPLK